ncbi:MAG: xanthine dehydrogenase family protein molybdopterin-binding subunit, partial [Deltaproteobacteria bacterium]|nr:xanthine dehydrogenase family protein molybdopterin-binding subunit [Deltaproteobacteria bacterium]MBW2536091.1 xanthine dehydrogenase family protein molybdopterin-binding subunit [Deltaproteobacteria bacterium]
MLTISGLGCEESKPRRPAAPTTASDAEASAPRPTEARTVELSGWVQVRTDDTVTMVIAESEMGQGVLTGMAMVLAEEMGADWQRVRAEHAPSNSKIYGNQMTGGSTSLRQGYEPMRKVGATARAMLIAAAAERWKVPAAECRVAAGVVHHDAKKLSARFGELAESAAKLPVPEDPPLQDPASFRIIGKAQRRLDSSVKIRGTAKFGIDVARPGQLVALVARPPVFGGKVVKVDPAAAEKVAGVRHVVELPMGVAVVADGFWAAKTGRDALKIEWDDGGHGDLSSAEIRRRCQRAVSTGQVARNDGQAVEALQGASVVKAVYEAPFLAHVPMELLNATAQVRSDGCEMWVPTQSPTRTHRTVAEITGLPEDKIRLELPFIGCGFGRRWQTDFAAEAVHASKAVGKPVQVIWTREDDVRGGYYRPYAYNELAARIEGGLPVAWDHRIAGPSILDTIGRKLEPGQVENQAVGGAVHLPYAIPNVRVTYAKVPLPIPVGYWRSVAHSQNG